MLFPRPKGEAQEGKRDEHTMLVKLIGAGYPGKRVHTFGQFFTVSMRA